MIFRITKALREGKATGELLEAVQRDLASLADFKAWLSKDFTWDPFTTPEDLSGKITAALLKRQIGPAPPPPPDPERYLRFLQGRTSDIEVRDLKVGSGDVLRIPVQQHRVSSGGVAPLRVAQTPFSGLRLVTFLSDAGLTLG